MDKINRFFPASLFLIYFIKLIIVGSDFSDALVMAILATWAIVLEFKLQTKEAKELQLKLQECLSKQVVLEQKYETLKNQVSAFTIMRK